MKKAFTLIELIVSLSLVGIILLGIISINTVLNYNNQDYGQRYAVKSETQITLNHILNNASLAVGNGATDSFGNSEKGFLIGAGPCPGTPGDLGCSDSVNNPNSFCIHQDIPSGSSLDTTVVNNPASAPPNYTNSRWLCYTFYGSGAATPYQIFYCSMAYNDNGAGTRGAASCHGVANALYLGTAYSISNLSGASSPPSFTSTTGFSMTIQNCLNNANPPGTCKSTGTSTDPANNPEVQVSGSVIPSQESF